MWKIRFAARRSWSLPTQWLLTAALAVGLSSPSRAADHDQPPINYAKATPVNDVTRLQARVDNGQAHLVHRDEHGYLRDLLRELHVPESSQVLVFSKTSLQRHRIGSKTPRAIYFGDDVYVGCCQHGDVLE